MDRASNDEFRDRLDALLTDWGAEVGSLIDRLAAVEAERDALQAGKAEFEPKLKALTERADGQAELIEVLRSEADEAHALAATVREQEKEIVRLRSEIDSKQELVRALRRDADGVEQLRNDSAAKDERIAVIEADLEAAGARVEALEGELAEISEKTADESADGRAEVAALHAELEARKTLIRSLRADSEQVRQLESELDSKREIIAQLEKSINNHVETIAGLRRNADMWRRKYQTLKGTGASETATDLPALTNTDVAAIRQLEETAGDAADKTVAIDVRGPLREARKRAADTRSR